LRRAAPEKKLVIEVTNSETAVAAAVAGFDVVQAEKLAPAQIVSLVAQLKTLTHVQSRRPMVAAAGGVNAGNVAAYARAGADIAVTSSPYLARPCDVQVQIAPAGVGAQFV
jgi:molybdenum transport protein